ncbi:hypothetical protein [Streptomyces globisporus]|uniref:hypothetical protein n=1 Tax=Streptomyces globisporus TaxID=1908 RepID=UPI0037977DC2
MRPSPSQRRCEIVSPHDREARRAIPGNTRWSGYLVHVTETCETAPQANLITDIATTGPTQDTEALPGIHIRPRDRGLPPRQHLLDGGYSRSRSCTAPSATTRSNFGPVK